MIVFFICIWWPGSNFGNLCSNTWLKNSTAFPSRTGSPGMTGEKVNMNFTQQFFMWSTQVSWMFPAAVSSKYLLFIKIARCKTVSTWNKQQDVLSNVKYCPESNLLLLAYWQMVPQVPRHLGPGHLLAVLWSWAVLSFWNKYGLSSNSYCDSSRCLASKCKLVGCRPYFVKGYFCSTKDGKFPAGCLHNHRAQN